MSSNDSVINTYGIWIPGEGWLKGKDLFADRSLEKARQVARLIGRGARVYYLDQSIADFEQKYLEQERRNKWHIFKNLFKNRIGKLNNKA